MRWHTAKIDRSAALARQAVVAAVGCRRLGRLVQAWTVDPIQRRLQHRSDAQTMMELDDHLLRDIGLTRSQVHAAACGIVCPLAATEGDQPVRAFGAATAPRPDRPVAQRTQA